MRAQTDPKEDCSASLTIRPRMPWRVERAEVRPGYRLHVRFRDGLEGEVDMSAMVRSPSAGVFASLADPARFAEAYVEHGVVTWPGEIDLAPDAMHEAIKADGRWVLT